MAMFCFDMVSIPHISPQVCGVFGLALHQRLTVSTAGGGSPDQFPVVRARLVEMETLTPLQVSTHL